MVRTHHRDRFQRRSHDLTSAPIHTSAPITIGDPRGRFDASLDRLKDRVGYDWALVFVFGDAGATLVGHRGLLPGYQGLLRLLRTKPVNAGRLVVAFRGAPGLIGDICEDSDVARAFRFWAGPRLVARLGESRSLLWFPVRQHRALVGGLLLGHHTPDYYTESDQQVALSMAEQVAALAWDAYVLQLVRDQAVVEEQRRLARDLHDSVAQSLYSLWLAAQTAATALKSDAASARDLLDHVVALAETGLAEVRSMVLGLRPESLQTDGLVGSLRRLVEASPTGVGPKTEAILGPEPDIEPAAKEALYVIAREALRNAVRHADAQRVTISLRIRRDGHQDVELEVTDDGDGFDLSLPHPGHVGLMSMRERAEALGGILEISSAPGGGTSVLVRLPASSPDPRTNP